MDPLMDPTTEDLVQLSANGKEASRDSYLQAIEEIKAFLQDINDTHEARTPAAPEPELYAPLTDHDEDGQKESIQNQDPTTEDLVQLSANGKEASRDSYLQAIEEIKAFLQDINDTHEARTPAAPEPELYAPLTDHDEDGQKESIQNQDPTTEDLVQLSANGKEASRDSYLQAIEEIKAFLQDINDTHEARTPAAPEPELYAPLTDHDEDGQKESIQNQNPTTEDLVQFSGNSKEASTNYFFPTLEDIEEFLQNINDTYETRTPPAPEPELYVPLTNHDEDGQKESTQDQVTSFDERYPAAASQLMDVTDTTKTFITDCQMTTVNANKMAIPNEGSQMKTLDDDQSFGGGKMTFSEDQALYGDQMKSPSECKILTGAQMTFPENQTVYGSQMKTINVYPILNGGQMTFSGDQTLYQGQMKTLNDEDTPIGSHMMPYYSSSLPYPRFLYISSSQLIQGQPTEKQDWNLKIQRCPLQKNSDILKPYICTYQDCRKSYSKSSHLRIHERLHTGEKPYKCNVKGCTWAFSRSDELNRHMRRHTGERPYLCTKCDRNFARSDHLKQHQRVHR